MRALNRRRIILATVVVLVFGIFLARTYRPITNPFDAPEVAQADYGALPDVVSCDIQASTKTWDIAYRDASGKECKTGVQCDNATYRCTQEVVSKKHVEYADIAEETSDTDCAGAPLLKQAFVVDGIGGELRYNEHVCNAKKAITGTLVVFAGSGGDSYRDGFGPDGVESNGVVRYSYHGRDPNHNNAPGDNDYRALEMAGIRVVAVKWQSGVLARGTSFPTGWMTRTTGGPTSYPDLTKRPAAIIKHIAETIAPPGAPLGIAGTSGGSIQSASVLWHDIGRTVEYLGLHSGGGVLTSLEHTCGIKNSNVRINKNTGEVCLDGKACGADFDAPQTATSVKQFLDYPLAGTSCVREKANPLLAQSSFVSTAFGGNVPAYVGFLVNSTSDAWIPDNDMRLGAVWAAGVMKALLEQRGGVMTNWGNGPGIHGDVMASGSESFGLFKQQVFEAFGIQY